MTQPHSRRKIVNPTVQLFHSIRISDSQLWDNNMFKENNMRIAHLASHFVLFSATLLHLVDLEHHAKMI